MNHLILLILFSVILSEAKAQKIDEIYYSPAIKVYSGLIPLINPVDSLSRIQYQLDFVHNCMFKYKREQVLGFILTGLGALAIVVASTYDRSHKNQYYVYSSNENSTTGAIVIADGAVVTLLGIIHVIDAEKWHHRAHIGPNGLGVKYVF